jgi:hypothetical protein
MFNKSPVGDDHALVVSATCREERLERTHRKTPLELLAFPQLFAFSSGGHM